MAWNVASDPASAGRLRIDLIARGRQKLPMTAMSGLKTFGLRRCRHNRQCSGRTAGACTPGDGAVGYCLRWATAAGWRPFRSRELASSAVRRSPYCCLALRSPPELIVSSSASGSDAEAVPGQHQAAPGSMRTRIAPVA